jgi:hypothetical protein
MAKNKRTQKTLTGGSALSAVIRRSTDQALGFVKQRYTGKRAGSNIASDLNQLRRILNVEKKQLDTITAVTTVTSAGPLILVVNPPAQGTDGSTRDGDSIKCIRFDAQIQFAYGTGTTNSTADQVYNYYLVRYLKTPSSSGTTAFAIADFLSADVNGNRTPLSFPNNDLAHNFQVMYSGTTDLSVPFASATNNTSYRVINLTHECGFHQTFTGSAASTICDNSVFWVITALNGANTGGGSTVQVNTRQWYVDN